MAKRSGAVAIAALVAGAVLAAPQAPRSAPALLTPEERAWLDAHQPLRFAPDPAFPPIEWFDEQGVYRGLVADYFQLIGQRLGTRIELVRAATWDDVLRKARTREVDGLTAAQPTPERSAYLDWSPPILDVPNVIIARSDQGDLTLAALSGKVVAVTAGNALHEYLRAEHPGIHVVAVPDDVSALTAVSFGRADAAVVNLAIASWLIDQKGISNLRVAGDSGRRNPLAIATRSDQPILRSIMAKGLAALTAEERVEIRSRWIHLEERGDGRRLRVLLAAVGVALLAAAVLYAWNASLRRKVAAAIAGLEAELGERRRAEAALRASERKLALHLEQTLFGVIEFDRRFRVVYWNPAAERIFGWSAAEVTGREAKEFLVAPAVRGHVEEIFAALTRQRGGRHSVNDNVRRDGRIITCEWFNTTLADGDGTVTGVMSLVTDVSERARREEAQARAQRLESLAVLAGGIAHDFNNLLTGILANVSVAREAPPAPAALAEILEETEAAARRAQALTRQLLTFARGGAPVKQLVELAPVVEESAVFAARGATAVVRFDPGVGVWPAEVDAGQLGQVVQNLVLNAVEAMTAGGVVEVGLANVGEGVPAARPYVRIRVADNGPGIPPDVLPQIFDPFASTKARGSGLGLAVVHSIVARHGGHVDVRSRPGEGAVFDVLLPAHPGGAAPALLAAPAPGPLRGRILVMDDEEVIRRVAERVLRGLGCEVSLASDGAEAIERWTAARLGGRPFDVVLVDLTVPGGMGGVEVLEQLRRIDPGVKVVVSSGYSTAAVMAEYRERGFAAVIPKPWGSADVRRVLGELTASAPVA